MGIERFVYWLIVTIAWIVVEFVWPLGNSPADLRRVFLLSSGFGIACLLLP